MATDVGRNVIPTYSHQWHSYRTIFSDFHSEDFFARPRFTVELPKKAVSQVPPFARREAHPKTLPARAQVRWPLREI